LLDVKQSANQRGIITWIVFLLTVAITILHLVSAIFPNLFLKSFGGFEDNVGINPFEIGIWTFPLLITNFIIFGLAILYLKKRLPDQITSSIKFIFNFEVSPKVTFFVITILIGIYIVFSVGELFDGLFQADYYTNVSKWLENFSFIKIGTEGDTPPSIGSYLHTMLGYISIQVFGNVKVIPFIASISLLILTYFITFEITKKRFAGIVAFVILLQSGIFLHYDTSVSYPNFWILFYLLSLYLILKKWALSPISYLAGTLSKAMTAAFLPMTLFFIYRANISKQKKVKCVISYGVIAILGIVFLSVMDASLEDVGYDVATGSKFSTHDFWGGFTAFSYAFRFDGLVLLFLLPLTFGLFHASRRGIVHADSIMFLILGILLSAPFIQGLSDFVITPYRFIPLIIFFAMGVGVLLSRKVTE